MRLVCSLPPVSIFIACAIALFLSVLFVDSIRRALRSRRLQRSFALARKLEHQAAALLRGYGFEIEAEQPTQTWTVHVDGEPQQFSVRGDYLVRRGEARFIAEVKSGELAPDVSNIATRRQLLEYHHAFAVDGVLLIDAERQQISEIEFPSPQAPRMNLRTILIAFLLGVVVSAVILKIFNH